jgi:uncharacterized protein YlxW (UPF0749 family)
MKLNQKKQFAILFTAVLLGFLIIMQARSFNDVNDQLNRNLRTDIFKEIQILKSTNENLLEEIKDLEQQLQKLSNNQDALQGIKEQIDKNQILAGKVDVSGPGISLKITGEIRALWLVDTVNELFSAGAEAVSVNSIRLTKKTSGFDTIPNGQILLNSVILNVPYNIEAIGDRKVLSTALTQTQGIIERMKQLNNVETQLEERDLVVMKAVM